MGYFDNLLNYEWELGTGAGGAHQWYPKNVEAAVPDAHVAGKKHLPTMFTADIALKEDPIYREISERFHKNPDQFADAFARAWHKLTHRDMGPYELGLGKDKPAQAQLWQDPVPAVDHDLVSDADVADLKAKLLESGLSVSELVNTAWASASTFRGSDKRGGANGARVALAPQKDWAVNQPAALADALDKLKAVQMRALGAGATDAGQFTDRVGVLSNDFFVNLLDMGTKWSKNGDTFEGRDADGQVKWTATEVDLIFGSNSVLRGLAEVYAADDAGPKMVADFVAAWTKVMELDRFDLK